MNLKTGKYIGKYQRYQKGYVDYRKDNIKKIKEMWRIYRINNSKEIKIYRLENIEKRKKWIEDNKKLFLSYRKKHNSKRRKLGFVPLNFYFTGSIAHHINLEKIIYIPKEVHKSVYHNLHTGQNMNKINKLALNYLESK